MSNDSRLVPFFVGYASCINQFCELTICLLSLINIFVCVFFYFRSYFFFILIHSHVLILYFVIMRTLVNKDPTQKERINVSTHKVFSVLFRLPSTYSLFLFGPFSLYTDNSSVSINANIFRHKYWFLSRFLYEWLAKNNSLEFRIHQPSFNQNIVRLSFVISKFSMHWNFHKHWNCFDIFHANQFFERFSYYSIFGCFAYTPICWKCFA